MGAPDYRWQEEIEHERFCLLDGILRRVARGTSNANDARELARELGLSPYFKEEQWQKSEK